MRVPYYKKFIAAVKSVLQNNHTDRNSKLQDDKMKCNDVK